jgi:hypothetical protein
MQWWQIVLIVLAVLVLLLVILGLVGRKLQKKTSQSQEIVNQNKQTVSMLIIDKKKLKIKESGLPKAVQDQIPKYLRFRKFPLVKGKVGPKIATFLCDERVYNDIPVKKEVKIEIAGMYIVGIKSGKIAHPVDPKVKARKEKAAAKAEAKEAKKTAKTNK